MSGTRGPSGPRRVRAEVDHMRCVSNAMCVTIAPGVFAHNEQRQSEVVDSEGGTPEAIIEAAENCPTSAITVTDAVTGETLFP